MRRWAAPAAYVGLAALVLAGAWGFGCFRRVDGRSAAQWLTVAEQASHKVSYHAVGWTRSDGRDATFILDQDRDGRYAMRVTAADGGKSMLGSDGTAVWYSAGGKQVAIAGARQPDLPAHASASIRATGVVAGGRRVVWLSVWSGPVRKQIAIDRETGAVLAMITALRGRTVSTMKVSRVVYRPVSIATCVPPPAAVTQAADDTAVAAALGRPALKPHWLPKEMVAAGQFVGPCTCCGGKMAAFRYSAGLTSLTLFEMACPAACATARGCCVAPTNHALVETRTVAGLTVTAVGDLDQRTLGKVLDSLH